MSSETRDWFLRRAAEAVPFLIEHFDPTTGCFHPENWDERYNNAIYPLAYLYCTESPHNPHQGAEHLLQAALAGADFYVKEQNEFGEWPHAPSGGYCLAEWPAYYLAETLLLLGDGVSSEQRAQWEGALERYAKHASRRPFSFTSPSNEAWKCLALYRVGQVLARPEWSEAGKFQMRQLNRTQHPEGYWEEPVSGHGPSPTYHLLHLGALGLFATHCSDAGLDLALERAAGFAVAAAYPDGPPLDCLDGRSAFAPEAVLSGVPGLSRSREGRRLITSTCALLDDLRAPDPRFAFASTWEAFIEPCFLVDAYRYFAETAEPAALAPAAATTLGASATVRNGPWFAAACGETGDAALLLPHWAALERQSRLSLWHECWGALVGGGSQGRTSVLPLANVMLSTDYHDVGCSFGEVRSYARLEPQDPTQIATAYRLPRHAAVEVSDTSLQLLLVFGHGEVVLEVRPLDAGSCRIEFRTHLQGVKSAFCQLPLLLIHDTRIGSDGGTPQPVPLARPEWLTRNIEQSLVLERPRRGVRVTISRPRDCKVRFHAPVHPGLGRLADEQFEPAFAVGLLSAQLSRPEGENSLTFDLRIETVSR